MPADNVAASKVHKPILYNVVGPPTSIKLLGSRKRTMEATINYLKIHIHFLRDYDPTEFGFQCRWQLTIAEPLELVHIAQDIWEASVYNNNELREVVVSIHPNEPEVRPPAPVLSQSRRSHAATTQAQPEQAQIQDQNHQGSTHASTSGSTHTNVPVGQSNSGASQNASNTVAPSNAVNHHPNIASGPTTSATTKRPSDTLRQASGSNDTSTPSESSKRPKTQPIVKTE